MFGVVEGIALVFAAFEGNGVSKGDHLVAEDVIGLKSVSVGALVPGRKVDDIAAGGGLVRYKAP